MNMLCAVLQKSLVCIPANLFSIVLADNSVFFSCLFEMKIWGARDRGWGVGGISCCFFSLTHDVCTLQVFFIYTMARWAHCPIILSTTFQISAVQ